MTLDIVESIKGAIFIGFGWIFGKYRGRRAGARKLALEIDPCAFEHEWAGAPHVALWVTTGQDERRSIIVRPQFCMNCEAVKVPEAIDGESSFVTRCRKADKQGTL